ncbi:hypothetical protein ACF0H5_014947 [Mactra antiquata]
MNIYLRKLIFEKLVGKLKFDFYCREYGKYNELDGLCYLETTKSTNGSTTTPKTSLSSNATHASIHKTTESAKSTAELTPNNACQLNDECHKELNSCLQQVYASGVSEEQYRLTFGHGLAIGIGISIVLFGCGVGIALFIRRKTDLHKQCFGRDGHSDDRHEHVMNDILSVTPYDNNRVHNAIHPISGASTNVDSSKEYVSLGERLTHESDYTDLQNT